MNYEDHEKHSILLDNKDPLKHMRHEFFLPRNKNHEEEVYLCGNSLGLLPKLTQSYINFELDKWKELGVKGHFEGDYPWMPYHEFLLNNTAELVGGFPEEVITMNSLTANLHFMMVSFYRPSNKRNKILIENNAFPSDFYAVESQIRFHGFDPMESIAQITPDPESSLLGEDKWLEYIEKYGEFIELVLIPGVQYFTGEVFNLKKIAERAHEKGCKVGVDLAHAVGNIPLKLHDSQIDFAVWCNYKYLNSGPGAVGGCFVHSKHLKDEHLQRFKGWWGHHKSSRFLMNNKFQETYTAEGWQLSNAPIMSLACIRASLDIFKKAGGMELLREKSEKLTGYLEFLLQHRLKGKVKIITPENPKNRGCQLSIVLEDLRSSGKEIYKRLLDNSVVVDWREPCVIRVAPVPLYNSFLDVFKFVNILEESLSHE